MKATYDEIWRVGSARIQSGTVECDELIDDPSDSRLGLTIISRLDSTISDRFLEFLDRANEIEPDIYTYARSELHSTILSVVTCKDDFCFNPATRADYEKAIGSCLDISEPLVIDFRGLTASPSCVMAQGFPHGRGLDDLRDALRSTLRESGLHQTIDYRYKINTAHVTLIRFKRPLANSQKFYDFIASCRDTHWGSHRVKQIHFVLNDWYHQASRVRDLATFDLQEVST